MTIINKIKHLSNLMLNALYPPRCPVCDSAVQEKGKACPGCMDKVKMISGQTCFKCGKPLREDSNIFCYDCRRSPKQYERGFAVFEYESIKDSLYRFKYGSRVEYAGFYAQKTIESLELVIKDLSPQAFIPVPIHRSRYKKRGYNQAYEYALELSKLTGIPVEDKLISRAKRTKAQKELNPLQRQKNLKKAFKLDVYGVKLQRVCVIDDIYTTGSTINTMAMLLKQAGIKEVYFISIAIGHGL